MIGVYRELEGSMRLAAHVLRRFWVLKLPPVAEELARQIYFTGASATAGIVMRGALVGTLIIAYVIEVLDADAALAVKILLWVVLREIGPLIAAVLVHPAQRHRGGHRARADEDLGRGGEPAADAHRPAGLPGGAARGRHRARQHAC